MITPMPASFDSEKTAPSKFALKLPVLGAVHDVGGRGSRVVTVDILASLNSVYRDIVHLCESSWG